MKTAEEIASIIRAPGIGRIDLPCTCCGKNRIGPAFNYCLKCHRRGCKTELSGKKVRKCR